MFAVRFYEAPAPGQIGPQERKYLFRLNTLNAAKAVSKRKANSERWRLVAVFGIRDDEVKRFVQDGWQQIDLPEAERPE